MEEIKNSTGASADSEQVQVPPSEAGRSAGCRP